MRRHILRLVLILASHSSVSADCVLGKFIHIGENLLLLILVVVEIGGRATSTAHASAMRRCSTRGTRTSTDATSKVHITLKSVVLTATVFSLIVVKS